LRLKGLISGMARTRSGLTLLSGVTNVLVTVERLLSNRVKTDPAVAPSASVAVPLRERVQSTRQREGRSFFRVSQTRSDLGYTYWVVQGFGCYQSFALFDTWAEAIAEVNRRLASVPEQQTQEEVQYA
jgi:hypothetical protein